MNYWKDLLQNGITAGTVNYHKGFFGWKNDSQKFVYYSNASISNNLVSGTLGDVEVAKLYTSHISGFIADGAVSCGSNALICSNVDISGGHVDGTPIGTTAPNIGKFSQLSNVSMCSLLNTTLSGYLVQNIERYNLSNTQVFHSPSTNYPITMFSVIGTNFTTPCGTMPSSGLVADGTLKTIVCSAMGNNCKYTLFFGEGKLVSCNPLGGSASSIVFKRQSQSCQLVFNADAMAWIIIGGNGVYVQ